MVKIRGKEYQEDDKSYQWFGATLHSIAEGPIVVNKSLLLFLLSVKTINLILF